MSGKPKDTHVIPLSSDVLIAQIAQMGQEIERLKRAYPRGGFFGLRRHWKREVAMSLTPGQRLVDLLGNSPRKAGGAADQICQLEVALANLLLTQSRPITEHIDVTRPSFLPIETPEPRVSDNSNIAAIASFSHTQDERRGDVTFFHQGKDVSQIPGRNLFTKQAVMKANETPRLFREHLSQNLRFYSDLPHNFVKKLLEIQVGPHPITFPGIGKDKSQAIGIYMYEHIRTQPSLPLNPAYWEALGWQSEAAYRAWMAKPLLSFSEGAVHVFNARRIFDSRSRPDGSVAFSTDTSPEPKYTKIISVVGAECRGLSQKVEPEIFQARAYKNMSALLTVSNAEKISNLVIIPFGLGVFLYPPKGCGNDLETIKSKTIDGMAQAIRDYQGPPMTLHICGWPSFAKALSGYGNPRITFVNNTGHDAYTVANHLTDRGLNAAATSGGDDEWMLIKPQESNPGQYANNHTLSFKTSDEYAALLYEFEIASMKNIHSLGLQDDCLAHYDLPEAPPPSHTEEETKTASEVEPPIRHKVLSWAEYERSIPPKAVTATAGAGAGAGTGALSSSRPTSPARGALAVQSTLNAIAAKDAAAGVTADSDQTPV